MTQAKTDIDELIKRLLAEPAYHGHPLHEGLSLLWEQYLTQLQRLDRIASLSDRMQGTERHRDLARTEQFEKRLRQLEKMTRISDRYQEMMREMNLALERASTHDQLTDLPNRRLLLEQLNLESARSKRLEAPLCVALFDIDYFKQVNDTFGHDVGDQVLRAVADAIRAAVRGCDLCGRWGGEEFLLLLPSTALVEAEPVIERISAALQCLHVEGLPSDFHIGVSVGLTAYHPGEPPEDTISRADATMLDAKRSGRGRVKIAP